MEVINKEINSTKELFRTLNIKDDVLSIEQKKFISDKGYLIIPPTNFIKKNLKRLNELTTNLIIKEGSRGGWEGKEKHYKEGKPFEVNCDRLGNLIEKNIIFGELILIPEILMIAYEIIKGDIKVGGLNFRNPHKNFGEQAIHVDGMPRESTRDSFSGVVCYIYLDDATIENGATRIIPNTHKKIGWPDNYINTKERQKNEIRAIAEAGSIVAFNLNTWHAGAKNINGKPRKTIFIQIKKRDQGQLLNYKKFLSQETKKKLNECQKYLLSIRDIDSTQKEDSVSISNIYKKQLGKDRSTK